MHHHHYPCTSTQNITPDHNHHSIILLHGLINLQSHHKTHACTPSAHHHNISTCSYNTFTYYHIIQEYYHLSPSLSSSIFTHLLFLKIQITAESVMGTNDRQLPQSSSHFCHRGILLHVSGVGAILCHCSWVSKLLFI